MNSTSLRSFTGLRALTGSLLALVSLSACTTLAQTEDRAAAAPNWDMPHIKRPNLVVADIDRSLVIYRDVLGLGASDVRDGSKGSYSYPVFKVPGSADFRFVSLHEPSEQRVLNLTEVTGMDLPRPDNAPHMSAVVIGIDDLVGKFAKLEAMGLEIVEPRVSEGADFKFIEQAFVDPDGHLIVCYQIVDKDFSIGG